MEVVVGFLRSISPENSMNTGPTRVTQWLVYQLNCRIRVVVPARKAACVGCWAGTTTRFPLFLAPVDCSKISALVSGGILFRRYPNKQKKASSFVNKQFLENNTHMFRWLFVQRINPQTYSLSPPPPFLHPFYLFYAMVTPPNVFINHVWVRNFEDNDESPRHHLDSVSDGAGRIITRETIPDDAMFCWWI